MTDTINVRDHSQPCKHGYNGSHDDGFAPSGAVDSEQDMDDGWCPGGKELILRRESVWFEEDDGTETAKVKAWVEVDDE